ncbi:MAG: hypothetical protein Q8M16_24420 [Pirellulaceae bacterium]|nr:hypothetical protein [Pirellulaceae bacterium]
MHRCTSRLVRTLLLLLVVAVAGFGLSRVFTSDLGFGLGTEQVGNITSVESKDKTRRPVVMPQIDWRPGEAWPGEWITCPADSQLPQGLKFEVAQNVITSVAKNESDQRTERRRRHVSRIGNQWEG